MWTTMTVLLTSIILISNNNVSANIEPNTRINLRQEGSTDGAAIYLRQNLISTINGQSPGARLLNSHLYDKRLEGVSDACMNDFLGWINQFNLMDGIPEMWALEMVDAWGKFPEGLLSGHFEVPGDFDECLRVRGKTNGSEFKGRYCYTQWENFIVPLSQGTCYPSSCSTEEITIIQWTGFEGTNITTFQFGCYTDDPPKLTTGDIAMITILAILVAICILGTVVDLVVNQFGSIDTTNERSFLVQCILSFSLYTNTRKWLSTKSGGDNLGCIHGLRFLSMSWVVLCHSFDITLMQPVWNMLDILNIQKDRWTIFVIMNGTVSVDTFFTMSGLLFSYNLLKALDKAKGKLNLPMLYVHRYLRLTPTYALLIGFMATLFVYFGDGPKYHILPMFKQHCQDNWWHNLLYINNLWNYDETKADWACHGETWYLSNDFQFFLISPFLIYPLWRWRRIGLGLLSVMTCASIAVPFAIHYDLELSPTMLPFNTTLDYLKKSYTKPWMRISPYMVGLWAGYILHHFASTKQRLRLPKFLVVLGWATSTATACAIIFGIMPTFELEAEIPRLSSAFYAGFHRFAWGIVISWIIIACTHGYGGFVNQFLSWKVFMPLGRLTFCVYLISYQLQVLFHASVRTATSYNAYATVNLFFAHLVMSLMVSFVCMITMESPFLALEKLIFQGRAQPPTTETATKKLDQNGGLNNNKSA